MRRLPVLVSLLLVVGLALPALSQEVGEFQDVPDSNPFAADIEWLASEGITRGCNPPQNTRFCPDDPVTRAQMAAFLRRALEDATPEFEEFTPIVRTGTGNARVDVTVPNDGVALLDATFEWNGPNEANFVVWAVDSRGLQIPLLVDAAVEDSYQGRRSLNTRWHEVNGFYPLRAIDVSAPPNGEWTLTIRPMSDARVLETGTVSGQGEDVLLYAGGPGNLNWTLQNGPILHVEALTHDGSYPTLSPFLIDSPDPSGSVLIPTGTVILDIEADDGGSWTLTAP